MDDKALQQLQIASMLSSVAMEYGDVSMAADVLAKVSQMVNDQRDLVSALAGGCRDRVSARGKGSRLQAGVWLPLPLDLLLCTGSQVLMGITGLVNGGDSGVLDICSADTLAAGDSGNQSVAFDNIYYDENNCNACGWAPGLLPTGAWVLASHWQPLTSFWGGGNAPTNRASSQ
jgi:hypothetical protein